MRGVPAEGGSEAYLRVRRSAARARQRGRWAFFSSLLGAPLLRQEGPIHLDINEAGAPPRQGL